jgi:hypothetical protein
MSRFAGLTVRGTWIRTFGPFVPSAGWVAPLNVKTSDREFESLSSTGESGANGPARWQRRERRHDGLILIAELIGIYAIVRRLYKLWKDRTPFIHNRNSRHHPSRCHVLDRLYLIR